MKILVPSIFLALLGSYSVAHAACDYDTLKETTPTSRFIIHDDGTVTDTQTNLMWARCLQEFVWNGVSCEPEPDRTGLTWAEAVAADSPSTTSSYNDWRLPNMIELMSIVERACQSPAINLTVFPNTPPGVGFGFTWTSTPLFQFADDSATNVSFADGTTGVFFRTKQASARLVRGPVQP